MFWIGTGVIRKWQCGTRDIIPKDTCDGLFDVWWAISSPRIYPSQVCKRLWMELNMWSSYKRVLENTMTWVVSIFRIKPHTKHQKRPQTGLMNITSPIVRTGQPKELIWTSLRMCGSPWSNKNKNLISITSQRWKLALWKKCKKSLFRAFDGTLIRRPWECKLKLKPR